MSGATARQYFTAFLEGLKLPVTQSNLLALYGVATAEGWNDRYNPLNVIQPEPGSVAYNSVGVQRYADFATGVRGAVTLFSNSHWDGVRYALKQGNSTSEVLSAFRAAYTWAPGIHFPTGTIADGLRIIGPVAPGGQTKEGYEMLDPNDPVVVAILNDIAAVNKRINEFDTQLQYGDDQHPHGLQEMGNVIAAIRKELARIQ